MIQFASRNYTIILVPIIGVIVYVTVHKVFPEKVSNINSQKDFKGKGIFRKWRVKGIFRKRRGKNITRIKKIMNNIMNNIDKRALMIALIAVLAAGVGLRYIRYQQFKRKLEEAKIMDLCREMWVTYDKAKPAMGNTQMEVIPSEKKKEENVLLRAIIKLITKETEDGGISLRYGLNGKWVNEKPVLTWLIVGGIIALLHIGLITVFLVILYNLYISGAISKEKYEWVLSIIRKIISGGKKVPVTTPSLPA